jgi:hypothetical protein
MELEECLQSRDVINATILSAMTDATAPWGVMVTRYEIKDITPPQSIRLVADAEANALTSVGDAAKTPSCQSAVLLWKSLKNCQNSGGGADTSSDMIGRTVHAGSEITAIGGSLRYSGINWNSRLSEYAGVESIAEGEQCVIASVDGNVMLVKPLLQ